MIAAIASSLAALYGCEAMLNIGGTIRSLRHAKKSPAIRLGGSPDDVATSRAPRGRTKDRGNGKLGLEALAALSDFADLRARDQPGNHTVCLYSSTFLPVAVFSCSTVATLQTVAALSDICNFETTRSSLLD